MKLSLICTAMLGLSIAPANANTVEGIEIITISGQHQPLNSFSIEHAQADVNTPEVSQWLKSVPGANSNSNGPITGIAQYRGLYGDRVATTLSGQTIRGAGPNAMDAPLSYVNPNLVESISVYRSISPVSSALDSLGGTVEVKLKTAQVSSNSNEMDISGHLTGSYNKNTHGHTLSGNINISQQGMAGFAYLNHQKADNFTDGANNKITPSEYDKIMMGAAVAIENEQHTARLKWDKVDTGPSGTAALPMDIDYIDTEHWSANGLSTVQDWSINWRYSYQDARHGMDNFSLRMHNMPTMHRYNTAVMSGHSYALNAKNQHWQFGIEGITSEHDSVITNPTNLMFNLVNFNQVSDERHSIFAQYQHKAAALTNTFGVRIKQNNADAHDVSHSMAMMMPHVKMLQDAFNQADKSVTDTTFDVSYHSQYQYSDTLLLNYALAVKQRSASYQERYLWLPMQATGGLADGKTYIGNINLAPETAYQATLGFNYQSDNFSVAPQIFYQQIDDYIQGTPAESSHVKMAANMMGDSSPLVFSNIDASLYGADLNWQYRVNQHWQLSGLASYVRGTRDDINDDLYRIAPLNGQVNLHFSASNWQTKFNVTAYHKQSRVSEINNEKTSAGYVLLNWHLDYYTQQTFTLSVGISNLLDKTYHEHLAGLNRAAGNAMAVGEPITAIGRNGYVALSYQF